MPDPRPNIAILPYGFKPSRNLGAVPLGDLTWPLGKPSDASKRCLGDLEPHDHVITFPKNWVYGWKTAGIRAKLSLLIVEPKAIHRKHMMLARVFHRKFHRILTCNPTLLAKAPNARFFALGDTWVENWQDVNCEKTRMASLIASAKRGIEGHQLRHQLADWAHRTDQDIAVMGGGYVPFKNKADGLAPFRFSFVIENASEPGYFTEKLIDAFLCETVPIYWGAPDIADYFDPHGMILCHNLTDLQTAARQMSSQGYEARRAAIQANKQTAQSYVNVLKRAALAVL